MNSVDGDLPSSAADLVHVRLTKMDAVGAYTADRAAALSGVPKSTIHWWARHDVLVPSVSANNGAMERAA